MSWYLEKTTNGGFGFVGEDREKTSPVKDVKAHRDIGMMQVLFHNGTKNVVELKKFDCSGSPVAAKFKNHGNSRTNFIQKWKDLCDVESLVTDGELSSFMQSIWDADVNAATDVRVSLQSHTSTSSQSDRASHSLFSYVNDGYTLSRPTYAALLRLQDNYNHVVGHAEYSTHTEEQEISNFLQEITKTSVIQKTLDFLSKKGYSYPLMSSFEQNLRQLWFTTYPRHGHVTYDSSGFEHVFVGETYATEVVGFHNWVQFHMQEKNRKANYLGYIFSKQPQTIGVHFEWYGKLKKLGTLMYGTSPEFDIAMFTVCFYVRRNKPCNFFIDRHPVEVVTYDINHGGGVHIGTAYVN